MLEMLEQQPSVHGLSSHGLSSHNAILNLLAGVMLGSGARV